MRSVGCQIEHRYTLSVYPHLCKQGLGILDSLLGALVPVNVAAGPGFATENEHRGAAVFECFEDVDSIHTPCARHADDSHSARIVQAFPARDISRSISRILAAKGYYVVTHTIIP